MRRVLLPLLLLAGPAIAQIATPVRPLTDPAGIVSPDDADAQPVPLDDLAFSRGVLSAAWSPDGRQVFLSTNLTGRYNLWRTDAAGSWPVQLTQSDDSQTGLMVSPDGRTVYFQQDAGGDEYYDLYAVPAAGGPVTALTNTPDVTEHTALITPDGRLVITLKKRSAGQSDIAIFDPVHRSLRQLTHETDKQWSWNPVAWLKDRSLIANRSFVDGTASEVWRLDDSGHASRLLGRSGVVYAATDATAGGEILGVTTNEGTGQPHAAIFSKGRLTALKPTPWEQHSGAITPDGRQMLVSTGENGRLSLSVVDLSSLSERPLPLPPGVNDTVADPPFTPDGHVLISHSGADTPGEILSLDIASGAIRPVTHLAMASLAPGHLPKSRIVTYKSFDGTLVSAVLTIPFNLKRDGSHPAVVLPHGGPTGQATDGFSRLATALASRGYWVIQPNPRGSTGYGLAFQKANYQDLGGGDLKDEVAARDFLVATGYVDAHRVGITGGSYGGFMTLMAIGRTPDVFAAAVEQYGIIDWRTMWEHEDARLQAYQRSLLGPPGEFPRVYDACSPLTYIQAVKAPLLVLQGENDIRVPAGQAHQVVDALRARGNVVDSVFYPAEGHGFRKRENQMDALRRTVAWFEKYLKGTPAS